MGPQGNHTFSGSAGIIGERWIPEQVFHAAMAKASETNRRHGLELYDDYRVLSIRHPFADRLTYDQKARYHFIEQPSRWGDVAAKFTSEVERFRYLVRILCRVSCRFPRLSLFSMIVLHRVLSYVQTVPCAMKPPRFAQIGVELSRFSSFPPVSF